MHHASVGGAQQRPAVAVVWKSFRSGAPLGWLGQQRGNRQPGSSSGHKLDMRPHGCCRSVGGAHCTALYSCPWPHPAQSRLAGTPCGSESPASHRSTQHSRAQRCRRRQGKLGWGCNLLAVAGFRAPGPKPAVRQARLATLISLGVSNQPLCRQLTSSSLTPWAYTVTMWGWVRLRPSSASTTAACRQKSGCVPELVGAQRNTW